MSNRATEQPSKSKGSKGTIKQEKPNKLFYGDNLTVLRKIDKESVDLCYIDPPFNSKRNYNQIYNRVGKEDAAQAHAFVDTWEWDEAAQHGLSEINSNEQNRFTIQTILLIEGLEKVLGKDSLLAYLIHIALRATEIQRVLKKTGTFYLHCDPTASHYLKLVLDSIFCPKGGNIINEIVWCYRGAGYPKMDFGKRHDTIFRYSKSDDYIFNLDAVREPYAKTTVDRFSHYIGNVRGGIDFGQQKLHPLGRQPDDWWEIQPIAPSANERLGYPTQKPEKLLEKIIKASSNEGDTILDAYCGCGTTVAVAQKLKRKWIGIDITYQSISLILKRMEDSFTIDVLKDIELNGVPEDYDSAVALANKEEDKVRKEFEKWAILYYTNNRAMINEKKGGDKGIDGIALIPIGFKDGKLENKKIIFSVKSDLKPKPAYVRELKGRLTDTDVVMGILICLYPPTKEMYKESKETGIYENEVTGQQFPKLKVAYVKDFFDKNERFIVPVAKVVKEAEKKEDSSGQNKLDL